mmetsp:Transcript_9025/g.27053  ORF Transcript_9025/g.27053 Transcript_9025/m.27053 type:complete len:202 (-) Transcript_9025:641-1246(-)
MLHLPSLPSAFIVRHRVFSWGMHDCNDFFECFSLAPFRSNSILSVGMALLSDFGQASLQLGGGRRHLLLSCQRRPEHCILLPLPQAAVVVAQGLHLEPLGIGSLPNGCAAEPTRISHGQHCEAPVSLPVGNALGFLRMEPAGDFVQVNPLLCCFPARWRPAAATSIADWWLSFSRSTVGSTVTWVACCGRSRCRSSSLRRG